jgi:hypothetical protein
MSERMHFNVAYVKLIYSYTAFMCFEWMCVLCGLFAFVVLCGVGVHCIQSV